MPSRQDSNGMLDLLYQGVKMRSVLYWYAHADMSHNLWGPDRVPSNEYEERILEARKKMRFNRIFPQILEFYNGQK